MATLLYFAGEYEAARPHAKQALAIRASALGNDHIALQPSFDLLGMILAAADEREAAAEIMDRARRLVRRHALRVLPTLSESEQLAFLQYNQSALHGVLSWGWRCRDEERLCSLSAGWLINGKGLTPETLARSSHLSSPEAAALIAQLRAVRDEQARRTVQAPPRGQEQAHHNRLAELLREEERLTRQLGDLTRERTDQDETWTSVEKVRVALPPDTVLIDIARFSVFDFHPQDLTKRRAPARYAAWIIPAAGQGPVTIIDLGEADTIDHAVKTARTAIQNGPRRMSEQGEPAVEKAAKEQLQELAKLLLHPLLARVGKATQLALSPDGQLWLVPWAALPLEDGRYAVEKYAFTYFVSGRNLAASSSAKP